MTHPHLRYTTPRRRRWEPIYTIAIALLVLSLGLMLTTYCRTRAATYDLQLAALAHPTHTPKGTP